MPATGQKAGTITKFSLKVRQPGQIRAEFLENNAGALIRAANIKDEQEILYACLSRLRGRIG
jgi:hypothetical protein